MEETQTVIQFELGQSFTARQLFSRGRPVVEISSAGVSVEIIGKDGQQLVALFEELLRRVRVSPSSRR